MILEKEKKKEVVSSLKSKIKIEAIDVFTKSYYFHLEKFHSKYNLNWLNLIKPYGDRQMYPIHQSWLT